MTETAARLLSQQLALVDGSRELRVSLGSALLPASICPSSSASPFGLKLKAPLRLALQALLRRVFVHLSLFCCCVQLDYATRDKDELQVQELYYGNIVSALDEIFAKIM